jgi:mannitol/fructose-specific phosphotransferase system IIA component (Ntr-type)
MKLYQYLKPELINPNCQQSTTEEILKEMVQDLKSKDYISNDTITLQKLLEREKLGSTSIGNFSAVPHTKLKEIKDPIIYIGISKVGIRYHKDDKEPVHLIILILSPNYSPIIHLQILAAAASFIKKSSQTIKKIRSLETPEELYNLIKKYENSDD